MRYGWCTTGTGLSSLLLLSPLSGRSCLACAALAGLSRGKIRQLIELELLGYSQNLLCQIFFFTKLLNRYVNGHQVEHHSRSSHPLALSFSDLSVWCFDCDSYVDNQVLYNVKNLAHKDKFNGEEMLKPDYGDGSGGGGLTFELV